MTLTGPIDWSLMTCSNQQRLSRPGQLLLAQEEGLTWPGDRPGWQQAVVKAGVTWWPGEAWPGGLTDRPVPQ